MNFPAADDGEKDDPLSGWSSPSSSSLLLMPSFPSSRDIHCRKAYYLINCCVHIVWMISWIIDMMFKTAYIILMMSSHVYSKIWMKWIIIHRIIADSMVDLPSPEMSGWAKTKEKVMSLLLVHDYNGHIPMVSRESTGCTSDSLDYHHLLLLMYLLPDYDYYHDYESREMRRPHVILLHAMTCGPLRRGVISFHVLPERNGYSTLGIPGILMPSSLRIFRHDSIFWSPGWSLTLMVIIEIEREWLPQLLS